MKSLFNINDKKTEFKADYGQILNYFKNTPKHEIVESFEVNENRRVIAECCLDERASFKDGVFKDIFKDVVITTKQGLDGAKPIQNLVNKRKRFLSEHDGDYVHERRFDINFMESARREKVQGSNLIKINASANFSAGIGADEINNYAKEICEVVNFFESQGRSVELNLDYKSTGIYRYDAAPATTVYLTVKRPDQYLSKADIYRAFSTVFYRHIGFCMLVVMAEAANKEVDSLLGHVLTEKNRITVKPDEIIIHGMTSRMMDKIKAQMKVSA